MLACMLLVPDPAHATDLPSWSLELKGGRFNPAFDEKGFNLSEYGGSLSYKLYRMLEVGAGLRRISSGDTSPHLYPLDVFVLARGKLNEDQIFVPYIGGGWTQTYYSKFREHESGYHARGGIQFLLDALDRASAFNLEQDNGIHNTYFFIEAERVQANTSAGIDFGGYSYHFGLLFEF
jgi:hypothetical protein